MAGEQSERQRDSRCGHKRTGDTRLSTEQNSSRLIYQASEREAIGSLAHVEPLVCARSLAHSKYATRARSRSSVSGGRHSGARVCDKLILGATWARATPASSAGARQNKAPIELLLLLLPILGPHYRARAHASGPVNWSLGRAPGSPAAAGPAAANQEWSANSSRQGAGAMFALCGRAPAARGTH